MSALGKRYGQAKRLTLTQDQADAIMVLARLSSEAMSRYQPRGATMARLESSGVNLKAVRQLIKLKRFAIDGDFVSDHHIVLLGPGTTRPYP